jgi:hypothetical protein
MKWRSSVFQRHGCGGVVHGGCGRGLFAGVRWETLELDRPQRLVALALVAAVGIIGLMRARRDAHMITLASGLSVSICTSMTSRRDRLGDPARAGRRAILDPDRRARSLRCAGLERAGIAWATSAPSC